MHVAGHLNLLWVLWRNVTVHFPENGGQYKELNCNEPEPTQVL